MGRIIAVTNQKGGVGKTTTAVNLSACLAQCGKKVLLVDSDPQGNATSGTGIDKMTLSTSIYDMYMNGEDVRDIILHTKVPNLDIIPSSIDLAGIEIELATIPNKELLLRNSLKRITDDYEFIIIDAPPSLGVITVNILTAADEVLIPIQCEFYALEGLSQLIKSISMIKQALNRRLRIGGILLTMFDNRTNLSQQVSDNVREYFPEKVFNTVIPRNVRLGEAPSFGLPITIYDPKCAGADAYRELAMEVMES
ncbi:MAG: ParA family protein [Clostridia bacterium]|jgi:chromosome partitioning protein|nr:ParA family protein [Clostridia bacterium]MBQ5955980.1 ParA family protein [Clostridia bacterium]MBR0437688.1 ParA family protein [Clostridia bacterium]MBR4623714.1 ParA family protein [Clostridia bacterium]MBR6822073.1 ParA family protein [Clostridia bacterium]